MHRYPDRMPVNTWIPVVKLSERLSERLCGTEAVPTDTEGKVDEKEAEDS